MATKNAINSNIPIEISKGGTNATSMTDTDGVVYYDGTSLVTTTVGTATHVLTSNGTGVAPTFQAAGGGGVTWSEVTGTTQALVVNNGYITNNVAQVVCTLPDTAALGSVIRLCGKGAGGWRISQNAGESIIWNESNITTVGVGGYLSSVDDYDAVEIVCTVADTTWTVVSSKGNLDIN